MRTYNYLSNEMPRELIELYGDIEQELLAIMVKELKKGTQPAEVFGKVQRKIATYDEQTQKVLAVTLADVKKKAVKEGKQDFEQHEEDERKEAVDNRQANSLIAPMLVAGMGILATLNKRLANNVIEQYTSDYLITEQGKNERFLKRVFSNLATNGITIREGLVGEKTHKYSLENIIRREVVYEVNQANAKINMENFNQSSAKFIETTSHPTARTWNKYMKHDYEDHSSWQGKVFYSRNGEAVEGYQEFESTCGYGEMLGIYGINCKHQAKMNYTGESAYTQYDKATVEKQYELSQRQRLLERNIRKFKNAKSVWQEAGNQAKTDLYKNKIKSATQKLKQFCEKNNLKYYNWRTQI